MVNYKPLLKNIAVDSNIEGTGIHVDVSTTKWGLALFQGSAVGPSTAGALISGAVAVWESTSDLGSAPGHLTFTDSNGRYGVTVQSGKALKILYYAK